VKEHSLKNTTMFAPPPSPPPPSPSPPGYSARTGTTSCASGGGCGRAASRGRGASCRGRHRPQTRTPATSCGPQTKSTLKSFLLACAAPRPPPPAPRPPARSSVASQFHRMSGSLFLFCSYELSIGFYSRSKPSITVSAAVAPPLPRLTFPPLPPHPPLLPPGAGEQRAGDDGHRLHHRQERQRAASGCAQALGGEQCSWHLFWVM
jgi:hypothetical protein